MYEDLLCESIRIHGSDVYYLPREAWDEVDQIFGENIQSRFERAYMLEMYLGNISDWGGDKEFFSKFGAEIRENATLTVTKRTFEKYVPSSIAIRPNEGDLIFVPVFNKILEIVFVEDEVFFFTHGNKFPYVYQMECETFRYGNEKVDTGVETIDKINDNYLYTINFTVSADTDFFMGERVYQGSNLAYSSAAATVSNWVSANGSISLMEVKGVFSNTISLHGTVSGANGQIVDSIDDYGIKVLYDLFDNKKIDTEADVFIVPDNNPLGRS